MTLGILQYLLTVIIGKKNVYFVHENMDIECRKCTACVKRNKIHISFTFCRIHIIMSGLDSKLLEHFNII